jgi:tetratricopeptide (TPR) repeat protein
LLRNSVSISRIYRFYNLIVTRRTWLAAVPLLLLSWKGRSRAQSAQQSTPAPQQVPDADTLPEEDESEAPEKFVLNPLESERNIRIGDYYWHKGKARAALRRYEWATKYNPNSAEAFYKVAEAEDKLKNKDAARLALKKVMDLSPDSKLGREAKKKLANKS